MTSAVTCQPVLLCFPFYLERWPSWHDLAPLCILADTASSVRPSVIITDSMSVLTSITCTQARITALHDTCHLRLARRCRRVQEAL